MTVAILHHAGDGNRPPVRVVGTYVLAMRGPQRARWPHVFVGVDGREAREIELLLGTNRVTVVAGAVDTLAEIALTLPAVLASGATVLYISTEPGHVRRATALARIMYLGRGVRIRPAPSAPGAYRDPWYLLPRDIVRALWRRVVG